MLRKALRLQGSWGSREALQTLEGGEAERAG